MNHFLQNIDLICAIDDSDIDIFILQRILKICKYEKSIVTYNFARSALSYFKEIVTFENRSQIPGLVFLDINMPDMNGFEFLEEYSKITKNAPDLCKFVIVSSSENVDDKERASKFPMVYDFISKPMDEIKLNQLERLFNPMTNAKI